ncbi:TPA: hypothetical protein ACH3X1_014109 [Trebouxia sp. C0004]
MVMPPLLRLPLITQITTGTTASLTTSVGIQPSFTAGLQGSVLWDLASGYVYATAQTLAHVDLNISIETSGGTAVLLPSDGLVCGDCNAFPVVFVGVYIGVDQAILENMGPLAAGVACKRQVSFGLLLWLHRLAHAPLDSSECWMNPSSIPVATAAAAYPFPPAPPPPPPPAPAAPAPPESSGLVVAPSPPYLPPGLVPVVTAAPSTSALSGIMMSHDLDI